MNIRSTGWRGFAIAALFAFGIVTTIATGGGGGGGGGGGTATGPTLPISVANAPLVSSALVIAISTTFDLGDLTGAGLPVQAADTDLSLSGTKGVDNLLLGLAQAGEISECANGGTVDITYTLANPNALTVGDSIVAVFDNCDDNFGYVVSGTVDLAVSAIQGDIFSDVFLLGLNVTMSQLSIDDGTDTATLGGSFTMTFDNLDFPVIGLNIAGDYLHFAAAGETVSLTDFDHDLRVDFGVMPEAIVARVSGRLESTGLGGSVDYQTPVAVEALDDLDPHSGEILITGASGSSIRIVIVDTSHVTLEVDSNGDGTIDEYIYTNWSVLNGHTSTINSSTAPVLAREIYNGVTGFGSVTTTAGAQFAATAPFDQVDQLNVTGDFGPLEIPCVVSGAASVSGSKASADGFTAADHLAAVFTACARGGEELNGGMDFTVASFARGTGSAFQVTGNVTQASLIRTMGGSCFTGSGTFDTSHDAFFTTVGVTHVEAAAASFDVSTGGRSQHLVGASNSADILVTQQPVVVSRSSSGSLTGTDLTGSYDYQTPSPVLFHIDQDPATGPYAGELLVTASDGSTMRMVALDEFNLRLDIDLNGDSFVDEELLTTWATLAYDDWICP